MSKVSGVVEEMNEEDEQLRREFEEFGEPIKNKITDKNRPLLIKKLNHMRARRRMSEKLSQSVVKEATKRPTASRRGRGRKGRSVKNEHSDEAALDNNLTTGGEDPLNYTFSISDISDDDESPVKQSKYIPTATDGPYAVLARKTAAGKSQNTNTVQYSDMPHESGSTSMVQNGVPTSKSLSATSSQNLNQSLPAKKAAPKRCRSRTVNDLRVDAVAKVSVESESADDSNVQKAPLPVKRNARASAVSAAAKLPPRATEEESIGDDTTSKSLEAVGKQSAASRIPKLARFPTPPQKQVSNSSNSAAHLRLWHIIVWVARLAEYGS